MAKTAKKKPMSKAAAAALKELENLVIKTAELDVHTKQVTERLKAAGLSSDIGSIAYAGRRLLWLRPGTSEYQLGWLRLDLA